MTAHSRIEADRPSDFWAGFRLGIPVVVASAPFGLLYGAVAVQNGLSVFETALMSAAIFGGASQMVGIELFGQGIPAWLIVFSIFAVNFRHVLYSAAVGRRVPRWSGWQKALAFFFLVDPVYAETERRGEGGLPITVAWFAGMVAPVYVMWITLSAVGAAFGRLIPDTHALGFDFLLPIYFLGLVMGFRKRPRWLPVVLVSAVASVIAWHVVGSPWHVSIGAAAGILLAAILTPATPHDFADPEPDDTGGGP
jgi:predicted branched-subunit amino acid permease